MGLRISLINGRVFSLTRLRRRFLPAVLVWFRRLQCTLYLGASIRRRRPPMECQNYRCNGFREGGRINNQDLSTVTLKIVQAANALEITYVPTIFFAKLVSGNHITFHWQSGGMYPMKAECSFQFLLGAPAFPFEAFWGYPSWDYVLAVPLHSLVQCKSHLAKSPSPGDFRYLPATSLDMQHSMQGRG